MVSRKIIVERLRTAMPVPKPGPNIFQSLLVIAGIFLAGQVGLRITDLHPPVSPVWPPTGVAFAALILLGYRIWPEILIASFLVCESAPTPLKASIAISIGETVSVVVGAYLINKFARGIKAFDTAQGVF